jgi:hypothetical protein
LTAGPWPTRESFERWWLANVIAFNRLAVTDRREWERVARAVEEFQRRNQ